MMMMTNLNRKNRSKRSGIHYHWIECLLWYHLRLVPVLKEYDFEIKAAFWWAGSSLLLCKVFHMAGWLAGGAAWRSVFTGMWDRMVHTHCYYRWDSDEFLFKTAGATAGAIATGRFLPPLQWEIADRVSPPVPTLWI